MQLVFTPDLGSSTTIAAAPGSVLQFAARVSTHDYEKAVAEGTQVEIWSDLPRPGAPAGEWSATLFVPAPIAPEHQDAGVPANVLSLLPEDPAPVPTSSAAPETTLLVASFVIPEGTDSIDYQFTYRLAHSNDSGSWHTWLGDSGSNGHLILQPGAPAIEGLVFSSPWDTSDNATYSALDGTVASLTGPIEWYGWALDLDPAKEAAATPQRFSSLPMDLSATHIALFPTPSLTALNPAAHTPVLLSTASRLSLSDRGLSAHGSPIRLAPLSRSAFESSLPEHAVLLPESAASSPYVVLHDTRGSNLSILPAGTTAPGTQLISLDLEKVSAAPPAKTVLYSSSLNNAAIYTPDLRVAVSPLGADIQVCEVHVLEGEEGKWRAGLLGGLKVDPEPIEEEEQQEQEVESDQETETGLDTVPAPAPIPAPVAEPTKVSPPPIQTTTNTIAHAESFSPITPETARTPRVASIQPTPHDHNQTVLDMLKGVAAVVIYYVTRGAWSMFGWGFKMFSVGVHAANAPIPRVQESQPEAEESEDESDTNEVAPTPIDPAHISSAPVVVVGEGASTSGPGPKEGVNMPLTPPMSPKTAAPTVIPGPEESVAVAPKSKSKSKPKVKFVSKTKPAPKPKIAFKAPTKSTLVVISETAAEPGENIKLSVSGDIIPAAKWTDLELKGEPGKAWAIEVSAENKVEIGLA